MQNRYRAVAAAALIGLAGPGLAAGCGSGSSSGSSAGPATTTPGQAGRTATETISAPATPFTAIVEPFDPGHPARTWTGPAGEFDIDYSSLSQDPNATRGAGGYVYVPGTPVAIWG